LNGGKETKKLVMNLENLDAWWVAGIKKPVLLAKQAFRIEYVNYA
jgi:hypothetical protein